MLIDRLLPEARTQLVTVAHDAPLMEAAKLLRTGTDLVVVCDVSGVLCGVITKTDVVGQMSHCQGASCTAPASTVMTRDVVLCRPSDWLSDVWTAMKERRLKNVPIMGDDSRPVGVLTARQALQMLLNEVESEETLLRDYVMNVGYR